MLKAVLLNDLRLLQACIEKGIDVNEVDENGTSPLHLASFYGYHPIVHALIDARARVDARDREWFTPLQRYVCLMSIFKFFSLKSLNITNYTITISQEGRFDASQFNYRITY